MFLCNFIHDFIVRLTSFAHLFLIKYCSKDKLHVESAKLMILIEKLITIDYSR